MRSTRSVPAAPSCLESAQAPLHAPSLTATLDEVDYEVTLPPGYGGDAGASVERFLAGELAVVERLHKGALRRVNARPLVRRAGLLGGRDHPRLAFTIACGPGPSAKPAEVAALLLGVERDVPLRVRKTGVRLR